MHIEQLIPINQDMVEESNKKLKKCFMFQNVEQFITLCNMKALDMRSPIVKETAQLLLDTYRNLVMVNGNFLIESPAEISCKSAIELLTDWCVMLQLKRLATLLVEEEYPWDTKIVFTTEDEATPLLEMIDEEGNKTLQKHWSSGRIRELARTKNLANNIFGATLLKDYEEREDSCYFTIDQLVDIDDRFIIDIEDTIRRNSLVEG